MLFAYGLERGISLITLRTKFTLLKYDFWRFCYSRYWLKLPTEKHLSSFNLAIYIIHTTLEFLSPSCYSCYVHAFCEQKTYYSSLAIWANVCNLDFLNTARYLAVLIHLELLAILLIMLWTLFMPLK